MDSFLPPVIAKLMGDISDFQTKMGTAQTEMSKTEGSFNKLATVGKAAFLGLSVLTAGVAVASIKMADEFEKAHANLVTAVTNSGHKMTEFNKTINLQHKSFENLGYANTEYEAALAALTTATNNPAKALQYMGVVADLAAKSHHSLEDSALAVGKALAGNLRPIKQLGIDIPIAAANSVKLQAAQDALAKAQEKLNGAVAAHGAKSAQAKTATEALTAAQDKVNKAQTAGASIVAALGARLSGAASAQAETFGGQLKVVEAKLQDVGIKIGQWLIPKLQDLIGIIGDVVSWLREHRDVAIALAVVVGGVLTAAFTVWAGSLFMAGGALAFLTSPITGVVVAILAMAAVAVWLSSHWDEAWTFITNNPAMLLLVPILLPIISAILGVAAVITVLRDHWAEAWSWIQQAAANAWNFLSGIWHDLEGALGNLADIAIGIGAAFAEGFGIAESVVRGAADVINAILDGISGTIDTVMGAINDLNPFGSHSSGDMSLLPSGFRAAGGPVYSGSSYVVGEKGPELFTPGASGFITPNGAGSGGDIYITVNAPIGVDLAETGRQIVEAVDVYRQRTGAA